MTWIEGEYEDGLPDLGGIEHEPLPPYPRAGCIQPCPVSNLLNEHLGKGYRVIYADPPWNYRFESPTASPAQRYTTGAAAHYQTMQISDIRSMSVRDCAAADSVCFLWATVPLLPEAFGVLATWGYEYKTMLTWHKLRCKGMGYWFRGHAEHLLFGIRGTVKAFRSLVPNIIEAPVTRHSEKPEAFYSIIESVTATPRLELFARRSRVGWESWGNQIDTEPDLFRRLDSPTSDKQAT